MSNTLFIKKYQELQRGVLFDQLIELGFATISYSKIDKTTFFNNALVDSVLTEEQLTKIEESLKELERSPAIYFENNPELQALKTSLEGKGYAKEWEDSFMFHSGEGIDTNRFNSVKKVNTESELELFLKTFDTCYQKDDPQNPYGELGDYLALAKSAWRKHHQDNRVEYFIVYQSEKAVAVSALTSYQGLGYISNVGSLKEIRGQGFGKLATMYAVQSSLDQGNSEHFLITEEGHFPNEFYKRIGFQTRFTALGYSKK